MSRSSEGQGHNLQVCEKVLT